MGRNEDLSHIDVVCGLGLDRLPSRFTATCEGPGCCGTVLKGGDCLFVPVRHVIRIGNLRVVIRRLPAKGAATSHSLTFGRLCGQPRRWRRLESGTPLKPAEGIAFRDLYLQGTDWCRDQVLERAAKRGMRAKARRPKKRHRLIERSSNNAK